VIGNDAQKLLGGACTSQGFFKLKPATDPAKRLMNQESFLFPFFLLLFLLFYFPWSYGATIACTAFGPA
jgi:hypothetical protein